MISQEQQYQTAFKAILAYKRSPLSRASHDTYKQALVGIDLAIVERAQTAIARYRRFRNYYLDKPLDYED